MHKKLPIFAGEVKQQTGNNYRYTYYNILQYKAFSVYYKIALRSSLRHLMLKKLSMKEGRQPADKATCLSSGKRRTLLYSVSRRAVEFLLRATVTAMTNSSPTFCVNITSYEDLASIT